MSKLDEAFKQESTKVERRDDNFSKRANTKIWAEDPAPENPYITQVSRCHGYDLLELLDKRSFADVLFLLFQGELPIAEQAELLEHLLVAFINPGPRHPATRAAMNAGIGKTDSAHILPISLAILGGEHLGANEVEASIRWLRKQSSQDANSVAKSLCAELSGERTEDIHVAPGFGSRFGSIDVVPDQIAQRLLRLKGAGPILRWGNDFAKALQPYHMGWLSTGVVAAALCDLGFQPRFGPGVYQLLRAPGLYAHGIEQSNKPLSAMPFPRPAHVWAACGGATLAPGRA